jgi:hypothetical protein
VYIIWINQTQEFKMKRWTAAAMGKKGGKMAKHTLTAERARAMVQAREEKRRAKQIDNRDVHALCIESS